MNIDEKIKKYYEIKSQIEELITLKDSIGEEIKKVVLNAPDKKYKSSDGYLAKCVTRITYKYTDESAIINSITKKGLSDIYMTKKIDSTKLNKELKNKGELYNNLKSYINENITDSLEIKLES